MADVSRLPNAVTENWDWQIQAACRGLDPTLFFQKTNARGRTKRMTEARARAVCAKCPVVAECLNWALTVNEPYGMWGGLSPEERQQLSSRVDTGGQPPV
ncbi:MAG: WhiB family transcriptional regulator [Pseudonocardiales bacterium]|nr:WhiB family transcriptional regulator [Pseudonocardiales bacterium]